MKHPLASSLVMALAAASASAAVSIDWVTIGDPGNAAQSAANRTHSFGSGGDGYGAVAEIGASVRSWVGHVAHADSWRLRAAVLCGKRRARHPA